MMVTTDSITSPQHLPLKQLLNYHHVAVGDLLNRQSSAIFSAFQLIILEFLSIFVAMDTRFPIFSASFTVGSSIKFQTFDSPNSNQVVCLHFNCILCK